MEWFHNLFFGNSSFWGGGVAHSVLILALVIALGIALGKLKIGGIRLGVTWILFVGIAFSHFGMQLNEHLVHFVKEFGLILFVYSIGLQVGPSFFSSFKKGGVKLNMLATAIVFLGVIAAYIVHLATGLHITTVVGILSGAVTNTPGLGAAQQAYADMTGIDAPDIATGYAVAYPLGVIGIILSMLFIRWIFRIRFDEENKILSSREDNSRQAVRVSVEVKNQFLDGKTVLQIKRLINRQFVISRVVLGVLLGSIPIAFPGIPQPVKLGLAGGPLVVSILISRFGPHYKLVTYTTMSANLMLREIGIALFLACVGLGAGEGFVHTVLYENGYHWIGYGFLITVLPLLIVGIVARKFYKLNFYTLMGLFAGSMTDPPALAYSNETAGNDMPSVGYATVYPLTMFLRILTAQMLILCVA